MTIEQWQQLLQSCVANVNYTNGKGEESQRAITLIPNMIDYNYKGQEKRVFEDSVLAWDVEKQMWRRFKINKLSLIEETSNTDEHIQTVSC